MRYIQIGKVKENMVLAQALRNSNGDYLHADKTILNTLNIEKIESFGYGGIYINDSISEDINIIKVVSDPVKISSIKAIKDLYSIPDNKNNGALIEKKVNEISKLVDDFELYQYSKSL